MSRKDFKKHNTSFICSRCGHKNPPGEGFERNHCLACLRSLHVDEDTPGDRASACGGVMEPIRLEYKGAKGYMIVHRCERCGKEIGNRAADDDRGLERIQ